MHLSELFWNESKSLANKTPLKKHQSEWQRINLGICKKSTDWFELLLSVLYLILIKIHLYAQHFNFLSASLLSWTDLEQHSERIEKEEIKCTSKTGVKNKHQIVCLAIQLYGRVCSSISQPLQLQMSTLMCDATVVVWLYHKNWWGCVSFLWLVCSLLWDWVEWCHYAVIYPFPWVLLRD